MLLRSVMLRDPAVLYLLLASALWPHALRLVQTTRTPVVFVAASQPKRVAPATCPGQPQGNCYNPAGWLSGHVALCTCGPLGAWSSLVRVNWPARSSVRTSFVRRRGRPPGRWPRHGTASAPSVALWALRAFVPVVVVSVRA